VCSVVRRVRAFVAVAVPPPVMASLERVVRRLPAQAWRPVSPQAAHITLRFLGEQPEDALARLAARLGPTLGGHRAFTLEVRGLGTFPPRGRAAVLWAGCAAGAAELAALAEAVEREAVAAGLGRSPRPFAAHLTLARRRDGPADGQGCAGGPETMVRAHASTVWGAAPVREVVLFRSELLPQGPRYTPLARWPLAATEALPVP
jgi:2'-5' RNA ligase